MKNSFSHVIFFLFVFYLAPSFPSFFLHEPHSLVFHIKTDSKKWLKFLGKFLWMYLLYLYWNWIVLKPQESKLLFLLFSFSEMLVWPRSNVECVQWKIRVLQKLLFEVWKAFKLRRLFFRRIHRMKINFNKN